MPTATIRDAEDERALAADESTGMKLLAALETRFINEKRGSGGRGARQGARARRRTC